MKVHINTLRTTIRNFSLEDADDLQEILGNEETMKYLEPPYSPGKTAIFLASFCVERERALACVHKETGKLIGYLLFSPIAAGVYELGWVFHKSFWRQGYAFEACWALIDFAFSQTDAQKLFAETVDSIKSLGLMGKLGMIPQESPEGMYTYSISREAYYKNRKEDLR